MVSSLIRSILGGALLSAALLVPAPASADEIAAIDPQARVGSAGWRVDGVTGAATVRRGANGVVRLAVGHVVTVGSDIETGPATVVFLSRGSDRLVIQPNTRVRVAEPEPGGLLDRFMQSLGSVFYDVEPRKSRSFGVTAPYVAAVVKGTRFFVSVGADQASVQVEEGKVEVRSADGASTVLLERGQSATARPSESRGLRVSSVQASKTAATGVAAAEPVTDATTDVTGVDASAGAIDSKVDDTTNTTGGALGNVSSAIGDALDGESDATDGDPSGSGGSGDASGSGDPSSGSGSIRSGDGSASDDSGSGSGSSGSGGKSVGGGLTDAVNGLL